MRLDLPLAPTLRRLAFLGVAETDADEIRTQKATLTLAAVSITLLSFIWVGTYWALGLTQAAAIPLAYQVASVASLVIFARTRSYRFFRFSQAAMMTLLPFLLQWTLGGYVASSAVSLWALVAAIGTLFYFTADESIPWFVAFLGLTLLSGLLEPGLSRNPAAMPDLVRVAFFVLNVIGVSLTAYLLLQYAVRARDEAFARSEGLLLNVLPKSIAQRLKREPGVIAEAHAEVTVLFADVVDFTPFTERTEPEQVVGVLDTIFSAFDALAARHGLEKIKTIGDAYMVASGLPEPRVDHATAMAEMALDMRAEFGGLCEPLGLDLAIRIGMDSGPVIAGVIGRHKFTYDLWGDTVNTASRMESHGLAGQIQVSEATYRRLCETYEFDERGEIEVKGKRRQRAYLLVGRKPVGRPSQ
ncbi:MAG: adenylate/guanylate cyclase domain-containing protein [Chloroflexota bacterium]|nr:adenylate/guanylate cyclase domain-containing protein [Chloroflexota bacterium]MDQ2966176.1 adenylate/guanylate cyclase domain-containing protein [Chloroflexota bacterium]